MVQQMNAFEVFEIAEQIERDGYEFYCKAAEQVESEAAKELLHELADMELGHESVFQELKNKYRLCSDEVFPDLDEWTIKYLRAYAKGKVFCDSPEKELRPDASLTDILDVALSFERNTIVFFASVKALMKEKSDQDKIDSLIKEEVGHVMTLTSKKGLL